MSVIRKLFLQIAYLTIGVQCDIPSMCDYLACRYRNIRPGILTDLELTINRSSRRDFGELDFPDLRRHEGYLQYKSITCDGVIDLSNQKAYLILSNVQPLVDVDYFLRLLTSLLCFRVGGFLIHGAGIVKDESTYIFFGHSGSGKTTVSSLANADQVLSDDLVAIKFYNNSWNAFSTPFGQLSTSQKDRVGFKLKAMYRLVKDTRNYIETIPHSIAMAELLGSTPVVSSAPGYTIEVMDRCEQLLSVVPVYWLHFLPDHSFWNVINI